MDGGAAARRDGGAARLRSISAGVFGEWRDGKTGPVHHAPSLTWNAVFQDFKISKSNLELAAYFKISDLDRGVFQDFGLFQDFKIAKSILCRPEILYCNSRFWAISRCQNLKMMTHFKILNYFKISS